MTCPAKTYSQASGRFLEPEYAAKESANAL
jgi:hypothetical protein